MTPGKLSVFRFCTAQTDPLTGKVYLSDPVPFTFREYDDTVEHVVSEGDSWEVIAARYYPRIPGGSQLWRVIAEFQPSPPMDAAVPPLPGTVVYVPSERVVLEEIFSELRRPDYEA